MPGCQSPGRFYICGPRCDAHQPAAARGRTVPVPDPDATMEALRARQLPSPDQSRYGTKTDLPVVRKRTRAA